MHRMNRDWERFHQIVKGKIKSDLRKYMSSEELIGRKGKDVISIPIPKINLPKFTHGKNNGGIGQGQDGSGKPGNKPGEHPLEVDVTLDELADMLGQELQLPKIEPKGKKSTEVISNKYTGMRRVGPESLRSFKQTYKTAMKRAIISGDYDPDDPIIIPIKDDRRYRSPEPVVLPKSQAVIFFLMDVSGSMGREEKTLARLVSFWIDTWLRRNFKNLDSRYIVHDTVAKEVNQEDFYRIKEAGGTQISSAYQLCRDIIQKEYPSSDWNIYIFQYSDGEDWSSDASKTATDIIRDLLMISNQIAYCQVKEGGTFLSSLQNAFPQEDKVVWAKIGNQSEVYDVIKRFFQKGN